MWYNTAMLYDTKDYPFIPPGTMFDYMLIDEMKSLLGVERVRAHGIEYGVRIKEHHLELVNEYFKLKTVVDDVQEWLK